MSEGTAAATHNTNIQASMPQAKVRFYTPAVLFEMAVGCGWLRLESGASRTVHTEALCGGLASTTAGHATNHSANVFTQQNLHEGKAGVGC